MSERIEHAASLKEQRPPTLVVLVILSWVSIGFKTIMTLIEFVGGPLTPDEMMAEKAIMIEAMEPQSKVIGPELLKESIDMLEVSNANFWAMNFISLGILVLGFFAVLQMYNLKRRGFYLYLAYLVGPIAVWTIFYNPGFMANLVIIYFAVFGLLFAILYGFQVKRMS
jgi:hypothetical protein